MEVRRLYVTPRRQGNGIGTRLLDHALKAPDMAAAPRILIDVWEQNRGAVQLYFRFGFAEIGRIPFSVGGRVLGHDLLLAKNQS